MLERATACLRSGAARDTVRCTQRTQRSRRMLHSTFWNHGAGDLDLPPWAVSMLPMPSDLPLKSSTTPAYRVAKKNGAPKDSHAKLGPPPEGVFLDFLYPSPTLAWLQRSNSQQLQRWEKRNSRRLPDGFIVASRGYASTSDQQTQSMHMERAAEEQAEEDKDGEDLERPQRSSRKEAKDGLPWPTIVQESTRQKEERSRRPTSMEALEAVVDRSYGASSRSDDSFEKIFTDSPADLAESSLDAVQKLKNIMLSTPMSSDQDSEKSLDLTTDAWRIYESLHYDKRDDSGLKREMLYWLSRRDNSVADLHCLELYHSIPKNERDFQVYEAALSVFLRRKMYLAVSSLHKGALETIEDGYQISGILFRYAVDHQMWRLALRTARQHHAIYAQAGRPDRIRIFWLHVSSIPQLLQNAVKFGRYYHRVGRYDRPMDRETRAFALRFFKRAITQRVLRPDESPTAFARDPTWSPVEDMRVVFKYLAHIDKSAGQFVENLLITLVGPDSKFRYSQVHNTVSFIYFASRKMLGVRPSRRLLSILLDRLTDDASKVDRLRKTQNSITMATVVSEWKHLYGQLSKQAVTRILSYYARSGYVERHAQWLDYFRSVYPEYEDFKDVLWTSIYLHARRADLNQAQQVFSEIKRLMAEHGDEPDLKCWNLLLHAHSRADDLKGALTNLQNLIQCAEVKPTAWSFHPVLQMLAKRGDVQGTEELLRQYDELAETGRHVALVGSLLTAHVNNDDVEEAEAVLRDTIPKVKTAEVRGSLTGCFNILLTAYSLRRDVPSTTRIHRWMREEEIRMDTNSYAALIQALTLFRQTDNAYRMLTTVMKYHNVVPTAFHYALIMVGYVNAARYEDALKVHKSMLRRNIKPSFSTRSAYLKAKAALENFESKGSGKSNSELPPLQESIKEIQNLMHLKYGSDLALKQPMTGLKFSNLAEASPAAYFDFLIYIHGKRKCFEAVKELFRHYRQDLADTGKNLDHIPIRLLASLMSVHWRAGDHAEVEECWKLAKDQADEMAPLVRVPELVYPPKGSEGEALALEPRPPDLKNSREPHGLLDRRDEAKGRQRPSPPKQTELLFRVAPLSKRPAPARRHILARPLSYYILSLTAQSRISEAIATVSQLLRQGYTLDNRAWNSFIGILCQHSPPLALLAFTLTERYLIPHFPGWSHQTEKSTPAARAQSLQFILVRYLRPGQLMPLYNTLVRLAAALLDLKRMEALGRSSRTAQPELYKYIGTLREIRRRAPKTLFVVQTMPKVADRTQAKLLRRE